MISNQTGIHQAGRPPPSPAGSRLPKETGDSRFRRRLAAIMHTQPVGGTPPNCLRQNGCTVQQTSRHRQSTAPRRLPQASARRTSGADRRQNQGHCSEGFSAKNNRIQKDSEGFGRIRSHVDGKTTIFPLVFDEGQKDSAHAPQLLIILRRFSTLPMGRAPPSQDGQISRILRRFRLRKY